MLTAPLARRISPPFALAAFAGVLLLASGRPAAAWDCGPKECTINVCSGGVVESKHPIKVKGKDYKMRGNTHLYIVKEAVELLAKDADPVAKEVAAAVNKCSPVWEEALYSADDPPLSETGGAMGTHFYNATIPDPIKAGFAVGPDGVFDERAKIKKLHGENFKGEPTRQVTYSGKIMNTTKRGTARDKAHEALDKIGGHDKVSRIAALQNKAACKELGLALHYMTDMTQPMHSSSFSAIQVSPGVAIAHSTIALHGAYEYYAPVVQREAVENKKFCSHDGKLCTEWTGKWDGRMKTMPADDAFQDAAIRGNEHSVPLWKALTAHKSPTCKFSFGDLVDYDGYCFAGDAEVDALTVNIIRDAFQSTAGYLYAAIAMPSQVVKNDPKAH
jgi:phospholipase C